MLDMVRLLLNICHIHLMGKKKSLLIFFLQEFKLRTDSAFHGTRMTQYLESAPGNKLHTIRTPIIKSITHVEACSEVSTHQLSTANHTGCCAGQVGSLPGVLFVCTCLCVPTDECESISLCVWICGFDCQCQRV